jgi:hypothetical protein
VKFLEVNIFTALGSWADEMEDMPLTCKSFDMKKIHGSNSLTSLSW